MSSLTRLSLKTLDKLNHSVARPGYNVADTRIGHLHLGVGAFMRAFIGCCNDAAMTAAGGHWGIAGVSLRSDKVQQQLQPQDGLYTVNIRDNQASTQQLIRAIRSIDVAPDSPQRIVELIASPSIKIVTITVTEKGYCLAPDSGDLDFSNTAILHDINHLQKPQSLPGFLVAGLHQRRQRKCGTLTIVSCDNIPGNGGRLRKAVLEFAERVDPLLCKWIEQNASFPSTMVDRIVPATTTPDIVQAESILGVRDEAMVKAEPFLQWVIEDNFLTERPLWEAGGARFVSDVEPYELAKLQLLNGPHSALAYLGFLGGHELVSDAMASADFSAYIERLMLFEISPVTGRPAGLDHEHYIEQLLARFNNAALRHSNWQIAMDGSQKLPQRLLNTIRLQLERDGPIAGLTLAVAAWIRYALGTDEEFEKIDVRDPLVDSFAAIASQTTGEAVDIVARFVQLKEVFGSDLADNPRFMSTLVSQFDRLLKRGAAGAICDYLQTDGVT